MTSRSKTMKLTRKQVIRALRTEKLGRLKGGEWITMPGAVAFDPSHALPLAKFGTLGGGCKVCAVGSVLRQALADKEGATNYDVFSLANKQPGDPCCFGELDYYDDDYYVSPREGAIMQAERGAYLMALSTLFEGLMAGRERCTPKIRETLIDFVKKCFPVSFNIPTA